jgi:uncharacterized protein
MQMNGERTLPATQEQTWNALNDPAILKECIPGCESIDRISESEFALAMVAAIGPVKAKFKGKLSLADVNPPQSYNLIFEGQGGMAGFAKGGAQVALIPEGSTTRLTYAVNASVGGKLAQVGSRLVDGAAKKLADQFFARFQERFTGGAAAGE